MTDLSNLPRLGDLQRAQRGLAFAKAIKALVVAKGDWMVAETYAASQWPNQPQIATALKVATNAGTLATSGGTWGSALVVNQNLVDDFITAVRAQSVLGRLTGYLRVPFHVRLGRELTPPTVGWAGEALPKPVSEMAFDELSLGEAKVTGLVAISKELARSSSPSAELLIRDSLVKSVAAFIDSALLNPSSFATSAHPASLTNGLAPITSAGSSAANIVTDVTALVDALIGGGGQVVNPVLIMHPRTAIRLGLKRDSQGGSAFPDMALQGGTLCGIPVLTTTGVQYTISGGSIIVLIDADEFVVADDGAASIDTSTEAALQMDSAPTVGAQPMFSLWQNNLMGIRCERRINWAPKRAVAATAAYVDVVAY